MTVEVGVEQLPHAVGIELPKYETADSAGMDIRAAIETNLTLAPGMRVLVPTGLKIELPTGYEAQIRPRSGLAYKHGITVANAPGTIDADYRGEVMVALVNIGDMPFEIERGMRIAQMVIAPVVQGKFRLLETVGDSVRGQGGFGSTGLS